MNDILDADVDTPDFDARLRETMAGLAEHGVPSLERPPASFFDEPVASETAPIVELDAAPRHGLRRQRWLVAAGILVLVGAVGALLAFAGEGRPSIDAADPIGSSWSATAPSPLSPREEHVSVWTGEEMIVFGGRSHEGGEAVSSEGGDMSVGGSALEESGLVGLRDGAAYNPATDTWRLLSDAPFGMTYQHRAVWTGEEMVVVGRTADGVDAWSLDPTTFEGTWRQLDPPDIPGAVADLVVHDGEVHVFSNDTQAWWTRFDLTESSSSEPVRLGGDEPMTRVIAATAVSDDLVAIGPWKRTHLNEIIAVNLTSNEPTLLGAMNSVYPQRVINVDDGMWVFEADPRAGIIAWQFVAEENGLALQRRAESTATFTLDAPRRGPNVFQHLDQPDAVVTAGGEFMLVGYLDETIIWRPGDDRWRSAGQPDEFPLFGHSSIWTGTELIVWGGRADGNGAPSIDTGLRYRPE